MVDGLLGLMPLMLTLTVLKEKHEETPYKIVKALRINLRAFLVSNNRI